MVLKRKRNLKIDANTVYSVFLLKDLDPDELEDYVENRDTGMEADEEKEIHLQNIIKGSENSIPLPVIQEINNISRNYYKKIELSKEIEWKKDCKNEYIPTEEDKVVLEAKIENNNNTLKEKKLLNSPNNQPKQNGTELQNTSPPKVDNATTSEAYSLVDQDTLSNRIQTSQPVDVNNENMSYLDIVQTPTHQLSPNDNQYSYLPLNNKELESSHNQILKKFKANDHSNDLNNSPLSSNNENTDKDYSHVIELGKSNELCITSDKDNSKLQKLSYPSNLDIPILLSNAGENKSFLMGKNDDFVTFCLRRVLLRYEKSGFETYTCFRDRIFQPTFKSRRNEALMIEKISRMGVEFSTLSQLCKFYREKTLNELAVVKSTFEIVKKAEKLKLDKKQKKIVSKMLFEGLSKGKNANKRLNLHMAMTDRDKIQNLRNFKTSSELFVDIKYYDIFMNLIRRKKLKDEK